MSDHLRLSSALELERVVATEIAWDTVLDDAASTSFEILMTDGGTPSELHAAVAEIAAALPTSPTVGVPNALADAADLVDGGLVPIGAGGRRRAVTRTAGWLMVAAATGDPNAIAPIIASPDAPITLLRLAIRGVGPFGLDVDGGPILGTWREGGTMVIGPPGTGKTELLVRIAASAPGPVVAGTPNVRDIEKFGVRSANEDVLVYDPGGLVLERPRPGVQRVGFDPVHLVHDLASAKRTATWMAVSTEGHGLNEWFWTISTARLLTVYLLAAAREGASIHDVAEWIDASDEHEVMRIIARHGEDGAASLFRALMGQEDIRTRGNIFATAQATLSPFSSAVEAAELLDIDEFLDSSRTLVLLTDPNNSAASLQAVALVQRSLVEAKWHRADRTSATGAPLLLLGDEVTRNPAFVELPRLLAEGPSRGVQVVAATQTTAQLAAFGPAGAEEVISSASRTVCMPGTTSELFLRMGPYLHGGSLGEVDDDLDCGVGTASHPGSSWDPGTIARPGKDHVTILESDGRFRRARGVQAHLDPAWRIAQLDAAFSRAGAA